MKGSSNNLRKANEMKKRVVMFYAVVLAVTFGAWAPKEEYANGYKWTYFEGDYTGRRL